MKKSLALLLLFAASFAAAQQPQAQSGQPIYPANAKYVQGVGPGYWPTKGTGLVLNLAAGTAFCSGTVYTYSGGTLTMTASTTNYVYLDPSASCVPSVNTTGFTSSMVPVAAVITGSSAITTVSDDRTMFTQGVLGAGITGLTGDGAASGPGSAAFTLTTVNSGPGSCGDATHVCQVTTDAKGRVISQTAVTVSSSGMSNPMTTAGDVLYGGTSGTPTRLPGGTATFVFTSNGPTSAPGWQAPAAGPITPVTLAISSGTQAATSCTPISTLSLTGVTMSGLGSLVEAGYQGSVASLVGWGSTGGIVLHVWPDSANNVGGEICNQTSASIPYSAVNFTVSAR